MPSLRRKWVVDSGVFFFLILDVMPGGVLLLAQNRLIFSPRGLGYCDGDDACAADASQALATTRHQTALAKQM
jgi:hypothetical protein